MKAEQLLILGNGRAPISAHGSESLHSCLDICSFPFACHEITMGTPLVASGSASSELFEPQDPDFILALGSAVLPGDVPQPEPTCEDNNTPPCGQPQLKRRRSPSPPNSHSVLPPLGRDDELEEIDQATYGASRFGEYGEYMRRKRAKLQIQNTELSGPEQVPKEKSGIFQGLEIYVCRMWSLINCNR
jgi:DNA repair protein REV1